jgi:Zn-dependent peptidase ImmA (M78 family)
MLVDFTVLTNVEHATVRRRFSVCHEIVHTFFPDWRSAPQFTWRGERDPDHEVETLCQTGAAELIMPYWWFEQGPSAKAAASLEAAVTIARRFCVSLESAARRMVSTTADAAALVVLSLGHRKSERQSIEMPLLPGLEGHIEQPLAKLRIERTAAVSRRFRETGTFLPRNKSAPDQSICYASLLRASEGEPACVSVADEDWPFGGLGACRIEAIGYNRGVGESPRVLALIRKLEVT